MLYYGGEVMSAETAYALTDHDVAPGETLDISIEMTAPTTTGTFNMFWIMRNTDGENFGVDASGGSIYVRIVVSSGAAAFTATPTLVTTTEVPTEVPQPRPRFPQIRLSRKTLHHVEDHPVQRCNPD